MSKFIGRRIVPKHDGVWDINKEYEELSIVLDKASGESYISRRPVPVGTAISDEIYWMQYIVRRSQRLSRKWKIQKHVSSSMWIPQNPT